MNGLFGNLHAGPSAPVHPDIAAADPLQPQPQFQAQPGVPQSVSQAPQQQPGALSPQQQATSAWLAQQEQQPAYKYSVGNPLVDKYLNMFLP